MLPPSRLEWERTQKNWNSKSIFSVCACGNTSVFVPHNLLTCSICRSPGCTASLRNLAILVTRSIWLLCEPVDPVPLFKIFHPSISWLAETFISFDDARVFSVLTFESDIKRLCLYSNKLHRTPSLSLRDAEISRVI